MQASIFYDWIPFFHSINRCLYELSQDAGSREVRLMEKVHEVFADNKAIRKHSVIDPLSFLYALVQCNTVHQRTTVFTKAKNAFQVAEDIPTDWDFPTPTPHTMAMFYSAGAYVDLQGNTIGNACLWNLFQAAYSNTALSDEDVRKAIALRNVGFTKLSQVLFLINPRTYMPFDTQMNSFPLKNFQGLRRFVEQIEQNGIAVYLDIIEELKGSFPGCELWEINLFNVLINSNESDKLQVTSRYCQICSYASGQKESDHFEEFVKANAVWTGDAESTSGAVTYPVTEFDRGDIVLVRRGTKHLGGIGVIVHNEYIGSGFDEEKAIKIIWLCKQDTWITDDALGQRIGFDRATEKTLRKFREQYPITFKVLDDIRSTQTSMSNLSMERFKNIIFYGPPGTGKTRLAEQVAEWLTGEERKVSLIEAIENKIFKTEPDIEGNERIRLIQFHPSYTYEDFVRGIRADTEGGTLKYVVENRTLVEFALRASAPENQDKPFVLIIDEINRANLNNVLGELIYVLERRGKTVDSMYALDGDGDRSISLPHNLFIIGTMNSADRSVSHFDYAIRRRFNFIRIPPDDTALTGERARALFAAVQRIFDLHTSLEFDPADVRMGHSYFLGPEAELHRRLKYEITPLLEEYVKDGILLPSAKDLIKALHA